MRPSKFDPDKKAQALEAIEAGASNKDIAADTEIPVTTIANWRSELKKKNGGGKKRKRKMNGNAAPKDDTERELHLEKLENEALRNICNERSPVKRLVLEIVYLRKRLKDGWGDKWLKPITDAESPPPEEDEA